MWLPKDERRLLAGYYRLLGDIDTKQGYHEADLAALLAYRPELESIKQYGHASSATSQSPNIEDVDALKKSIKSTLSGMARVATANKALLTRKMITFGKHQSEHHVVFIGLTLQGYDLGRRYRSFWERSGLWFDAHRNHWAWLLVSLLGGVLGSLLVNWLS